MLPLDWRGARSEKQGIGLRVYLQEMEWQGLTTCLKPVCIFFFDSSFLLNVFLILELIRWRQMTTTKTHLQNEWGPERMGEFFCSLSHFQFINLNFKIVLTNYDAPLPPYTQQWEMGAQVAQVTFFLSPSNHYIDYAHPDNTVYEKHNATRCTGTTTTTGSRRRCVLMLDFPVYHLPEYHSPWNQRINFFLSYFACLKTKPMTWKSQYTCKICKMGIYQEKNILISRNTAKNCLLPY